MHSILLITSFASFLGPLSLDNHISAGLGGVSNGPRGDMPSSPRVNHAPSSSEFSGKMARYKANLQEGRQRAQTLINQKHSKSALIEMNFLLNKYDNPERQNAIASSSQTFRDIKMKIEGYVRAFGRSSLNITMMRDNIKKIAKEEKVDSNAFDVDVKENINALEVDITKEELETEFAESDLKIHGKSHFFILHRSRQYSSGGSPLWITSSVPREERLREIPQIDTWRAASHYRTKLIFDAIEVSEEELSQYYDLTPVHADIDRIWKFYKEKNSSSSGYWKAPLGNNSVLLVPERQFQLRLDEKPW